MDFISDPDLVVTTDDLSTYLGETVDDARGSLLLELAQDLCEAVVSPLPDAAKAVVLSAAARAYVNPTGETMLGAGPYQVARPSGNVYLTRSERASLRRLTGGGGAFAYDLVGINGAGDDTDYPDARFPDESSS